jgi:hypothetical protein
MNKTEKFLALDMIVEKLYRHPECSPSLKSRLNTSIDRVQESRQTTNGDNDSISRDQKDLPQTVRSIYGKQIEFLYFLAVEIANDIVEGRDSTLFRKASRCSPTAKRTRKSGRSRTCKEQPSRSAANRVTDVAGQFKRISGVRV